MKQFVEKHTYKNKVKYLYPYRAVKAKLPPYADGVEMVEVTDQPDKYSMPANDGSDNFEWKFNRQSWLNEEVRPKRNELLDDVDLRRLNADKIENMAIPKKIEWRTYKQELKDLPTNIDYENPIWPIAPNEV